MTTKVQKNAFAIVGAVGLALMAMMIATEDEPGLLPLLLVLVGAIGYVTAHVRQRLRANNR